VSFGSTGAPTETRPERGEDPSSASPILTAPSYASTGAIFRYRDNHGQVVYVDDTEKVPAQYRDQVTKEHRLPNIMKVPPSVLFPRSVENPPPAATKLEVLVTSWCPYCRRLEDYLKTKGIPFVRYDIEKDQKGGELYRSVGGGGVAITKYGEHVVRGFDPDRVKRLVER
jgi:hypothetical protein